MRFVRVRTTITTTTNETQKKKKKGSTEELSLPCPKSVLPSGSTSLAFREMKKETSLSASICLHLCPFVTYSLLHRVSSRAQFGAHHPEEAFLSSLPCSPASTPLCRPREPAHVRSHLLMSFSRRALDPLVCQVTRRGQARALPVLGCLKVKLGDIFFFCKNILTLVNSYKNPPGSSIK